jgi:hypothetical protein
MPVGGGRALAADQNHKAAAKKAKKAARIRTTHTPLGLMLAPIPADIPI